MNNQKLSDFYNLTPLRMTKLLESFKEEDSLYQNTIEIINPNYIFGLEIEAENITYVGKAKYKSYWDITGDNSLRNHGIEFVSKPIKAFQIEYAIDQVHNQLKGYSQPDFTPRTSTHVHMNVRDLTVQQILNLVLIYTSVENVLFNWVDHNRDKNIFCIKLTDTDYVTKYKDLVSDIRNTVANWNKYTALNLKPIESKGTVEFRHMYGTWDKEIILLWINFLSCIKTYARTKTTEDLYKEIQELNTNSLYEEYLFSIFGKYTKYLTQNITNLQDLLEDSITYVKLSTLIKKKEPSEYGTIRIPVRDDIMDAVEPPIAHNAPEEIPNVTLRNPNNQIDWTMWDQLIVEAQNRQTQIRTTTTRPLTIEERFRQQQAARQRNLDEFARELNRRTN